MLGDLLAPLEVPPQDDLGVTGRTEAVATPLQIATAYAALGNGGKRVTPTFVKGERHETREVLSPQVADQVMQMMQTVTEPGGTATQYDWFLPPVVIMRLPTCVV